MNNANRSVALFRARQLGLIAFALAVAWSAYALATNTYIVQPVVSRAQRTDGLDIEYAERRPAGDYVAAVRKREMFKASVLYRTKEKAVVDALEGLVYLGLVRQGGVARAFIQNSVTSQSSMYSEGETVGDARIEQILGDRIIFTRGDARLELLLK